MKINKKVSDLARKLEYIGIDLKERRNIIKVCMHPLNRIFNSLEKTIDESYKTIKKGMDELERQKMEYENLNEENKRYLREIKYIALQN